MTTADAKQAFDFAAADAEGIAEYVSLLEIRHTLLGETSGWMREIVAAATSWAGAWQ